MYKFMSWLIIAFIGLVPPGAFFDAKQPPKPNIEQSFMKREKRATNLSQCGNSCKLEFASIQNSYVFKWPSLGYVWNTDDKLDDLPQDVSALTIPEGGSMSGYVFNFYKKNTTKIVNVNSEYDKYYIDKIVNVKITILKASTFDRYDRRAGYIITSFSAEMPSLPGKDNEQSLPTEITKNDGEYQYNQFQDKLDYLMIQRRDFDKFNYSYLYWVPIFNFFDENFKYMNEISIKLNGFKQNSKFSLSRKNSYPPGFIEKVIFRELSFSSFGDVITIKTEHGSIVGNNEFLENGKSILKFGSVTSFGIDFINTFFGQVNYYGNTFHFLRYDDKLKSDFKDFMLHYQKDLTIDFINGLFDKIYKVLGGFFVQFFYASFDMDTSTYVELDYKGTQQIPKNVLQMGFFYRSLITFYPKQYLINFGSTIENSKNMIFRSYFFVKDKQTANGFNTGKSSYQIDFNVLKAYDNQLWNATSNKLHFYNDISTI
ncbi:hypothetical protein [Spiroplasma endosymbiont of Dilophus febrilis]|uniref:hypothetical protein n=1 Tax=Spiroplasma endosymbiont of Dilophus febrilis TaxID=3066292 RepID=UPI00313ADF90